MNTSAYLFTVLIFLTGPLQANTQQLLQLIDYVGVDYSDAVVDGQISNQSVILWNKKTAKASTQI
ncbi:MAG TPA: hypothetical protein VIQ03_01575 [Gammaproteobacteria bacterium]